MRNAQDNDRKEKQWIKKRSEWTKIDVFEFRSHFSTVDWIGQSNCDVKTRSHEHSPPIHQHSQAVCTGARLANVEIESERVRCFRSAFGDISSRSKFPEIAMLLILLWWRKTNDGRLYRALIIMCREMLKTHTKKRWKSGHKKNPFETIENIILHTWEEKKKWCGKENPKQTQTGQNATCWIQ